jgi:uncharacterized protein YjbJ (UPF0337 family)
MGYTEHINSILKWGNSFQRQFDFPLDRSSLHSSYEDAVAYAKGDKSDSREFGDTAYIGQTITVWGPNEKGVEGVWVYSLVPAPEGAGYLADLKPVGSATTETAQNYSAAKTLSENLAIGQLILVSESEDIEETVNGETVTNTYQAGFYIVNAPGSISALDTSSGASDEIGAISGRVTSLEGKVSTLEGNRVLTSDFETYKGEVTGAIGEVSTALETYKGEVSTTLEGKVSNDALDTYKGEVTGAIGEVSTALDTYKGEVSTALNSKANADDLSTLEGRVNTDIQNLTDHLTDYSKTLGEVDTRLDGVDTTLESVESRLVELEAFEETHASIGESDIIGLFTPNTEA